MKKEKKNPGDIIILLKCTKNHDHMLYCSWDMVHEIGLFVALLAPPPPPHLPNSPKNQNFKKWKEKKSLEILSFYTYVPKIMIRWCTVPEIWCTADVLTDGRTDGRTEKVIYRGGCPPKNPNYLAQELVNISRWKYFICF